MEAIQQQDPHRAVILAQRCVHRHGMPTLEALLERANASAVGGSQGDARTWLLPLLTQPPPTPDSSESHTLPLEEHGPAPLSAKLDEAFAPLEIAFPPLPIIGEVAPEAEGPSAQALVHSDPMSAVRLEEAIRLTDLSLEKLEVPSQEPGQTQTAEEAEGDQIGKDLLESQTGQVAGDVNEGFQLVGADLAEKEAAPVPTFQLEDPPLRQRSTRKDRHPERRGSIPPAPISPALEPWLAWLPGAHRPGARP